jgi:hypothetical protein
MCIQDAASYEQLRGTALSGVGLTRAVWLLRNGLTAWLNSEKSPEPQPLPEVPIGKPSPTAMPGGGPLAAALASIILRLASEGTYV